MNRRIVLKLLCSAVLAPATALAQRNQKRPVVAYVFGPVPGAVMAGAEPANAHVRAFVQRLRELGWEDGRNLVLERHGAENRTERAQTIFADLVARKVDVNYAAATAQGRVIALDALQATRTIPIVFAGGSDPVAWGLVASLARPGGNATGVATASGLEIHGRRLEMLKEIAPRIKRVAFLDAKGILAEYTSQAAAKLGLGFVHAEVAVAEDYAAAFATVLRERADALLVGGNSLHLVNASHIAAFAAQQKLPTASLFPELIDAGLLMSYGIDYLDLNRRAAVYVDKILRGANPADLPVELPRKFDFVLNQKTARTLGITIPLAVLLQADRVIE